MKKREKILCLIMFLFIYFLIPKNVLAVTESRNCVCTGTIDTNEKKQAAAEIHLSYDEWLSVPRPNYTVNVSKWDTGSGLPGLFDRPSNNKSKFEIKPAQGGIACPKYVILNVRGNKTGDTYSGTGKVYMYTERGLTEGDRQWYSSSVNDAAKKCTGFCKYNEWAFLTCENENSTNDLIPNDENHSNTEVNGDVKSTVEKNTGEDVQGKGEGEKQKKVINYDPKAGGESEDQTCMSVLGDVNDSETVAWLLQKILNYIRIFGILLVLVFSALEFSKVILSNDYEALKKAQHKTVYRVGAIVALFLLPSLVSFLLGLFISGNIDFSCGFR